MVGEGDQPLWQVQSQQRGHIREDWEQQPRGSVKSDEKGGANPERMFEAAKLGSP